jgi:sugar-specific transcriptional regulator TrmB
MAILFEPVKLFLSMKNNGNLVNRLEKLGLSVDEANIFLSLLEAPKTPLQVSRATGIARSNVYRLIDGLMEKSIVHEVMTSNGKLLAASKPETLELLVTEQETIAQARRTDLQEILPLLQNLVNQEANFAIKTYHGVAGLKQMLWNELKTETEIQIFSCGSLNSATGKTWAEKFRQEIIQRKIKQRSLENHREPEPLSIHKTYGAYYQVRYLSEKILTIKPEITIHDDTISLYNSWTHDVQLGTEIKNPFLATFMRQVFEHYWGLGKA